MITMAIQPHNNICRYGMQQCDTFGSSLRLFSWVNYQKLTSFFLYYYYYGKSRTIPNRSMTEEEVVVILMDGDRSVVDNETKCVEKYCINVS